jgi:hypothetical protein
VGVWVEKTRQVFPLALLQWLNQQHTQLKKRYGRYVTSLWPQTKEEHPKYQSQFSAAAVHPALTQTHTTHPRSDLFCW